MTLLPSAFRKRVRTRERRNRMMTLRTVLEFIELCDEEGYREERVMMQAYRELAEDMCLAEDTVRDLVGKVRRYPPDKIVYWFDNGLGFDHLEKAPALSEVAHKTPAKLLDEAADLGDEKGDPMSVRQMTAHALGEHQASGMSKSVFQWAVLRERLGKLPIKLGWDDDKATRFEARLQALYDEFFK